MGDEFERGRQTSKMGVWVCDVSRGLVGAEICALGHQKREGRQKHLERVEKYKMLKEIGTAEQGKGCSQESCQMAAVQVAWLVVL